MAGLFDSLINSINPNLFPTTGKVFLETLQGNKEPITEKTFTPEQQKFMLDLIKSQDKAEGNIQYKDYIDFAKKLKTIPASITPSLFSMFDPLGNVQTTLGRFSYKVNPDGTVVIKDNYDFNPSTVDNSFSFNPYDMVRKYAGQKIPTGKGREVLINLNTTGLEPSIK